MHNIIINKSALLGGRFRIFIDDVLIEDSCDCVSVGNSFELCLKEHKVFSNDSTYQEELIDTVFRRGWRYGGSWDDIIPANYSVCKYVVTINEDSRLDVSMKKSLNTNNMTVFNVQISNGQITETYFINGITETEYKKCKQFSYYSYGAIGVALVILILVATIFGGIEGLTFFGPVCLLISLFVIFSGYLSLKRIKRQILKNR